MIKNISQKELAAKILSNVCKSYEALEPSISVCKLSNLVGINRRNLARYLCYGADTDLPFASLICICRAIGTSLADVIPSNALPDYEEDLSIADFLDNQENVGVVHLNDAFVDLIWSILANKYPEGTLYCFQKCGNIDISDRGIRKIFKKGNNDHYPLITTSTALKVLKALHIGIV